MGGGPTRRSAGWGVTKTGFSNRLLLKKNPHGGLAFEPTHPANPPSPAPGGGGAGVLQDKKKPGFHVVSGVDKHAAGPMHKDACVKTLFCYLHQCDRCLHVAIEIICCEREHTVPYSEAQENIFSWQ